MVTSLVPTVVRLDRCHDVDASDVSAANLSISSGVCARSPLRSLVVRLLLRLDRMSEKKGPPEASRKGAILELREDAELKALVRYRYPVSHGARGMLPRGTRFVVFEDFEDKGVSCLPERMARVAPVIVEQGAFDSGLFQDLVFDFTNEQLDTLLKQVGSIAHPQSSLLPEAATRVEGAGARCQDFAEVVSFPGLTLAVVADGAGGMSGGELAAKRVVELVSSRWGWKVSGDRIASWLAEADAEIQREPNAGFTTAVVVAVTSMEITGASVGDSEAWLLNENIDILTGNQQRKLLIGSGRAIPVPFSRERASGSLLVGSDGLFKYTSEASIRAAFRREAPALVADALVKAVRLPSGALHDDVAAIVVQL